MRPRAVLLVWVAVALLLACSAVHAADTGAGDARSQRPSAPAANAAASGTSGEDEAERAASEVTVFHLHKILRKVGVERDTWTPGPGGTLEAKAVFGFQDRGVEVPLAARFLLGPAGAVLSYEAWGSTSRLSVTDDRVEIAADGSYVTRRLGAKPERARPSGPFAVAAGYAPVLAQDLMLREWVKSGRPGTLALVPEGTLAIESRGTRAYGVEGKSVELEHVSVRGLVWGREDAWLDADGKLVALVTRDAEFDHFEAVREGFVELLPELMTLAGADGVRWLSEAGRAAERSQAGPVALLGATLIDGTGAAPVRDAVLVYDRGTIVAVGPRSRFAVPPGAATRDLANKTIIPGLWDMHAHFQQVEHGAAYLAAGVTTARDLGNILEFVTGVRDAIDSPSGLGPRILVSGIVDGEGPRSAGTVTISSKRDIAPVIERFAHAGCLEVKLYSSIDPELVRPIAAEAHRRGLRVVGHVPEGMDVVRALADGYDGISHASYLFGPLFLPGERQKLSRSAFAKRIAGARFDDPRLARVVAAFTKKKAFLDDTLALFELVSHPSEVMGAREPGLSKLPRELSGLFEGVRPEEAGERRAMFERYLAFVRELHRRGVPVVAGTDISVPGHSLHRELELYVEAGMTPMEAILAATSVPARVMRLDQQSGTLEPGKRADFVVLDGDPLSDIRNIRKVETVVARGKAYDPKALWRMIGFLP